MRDYLIWFLGDFAYAAEDAALLLAAYDAVMGNSEAREQFMGAIATYQANIDCDFGALTAQSKKAARLSGVHNHTTDLLLFICLSKHLHSLYAARGIDDTVWHDSMLDLRYKLEECKLIKGVIGTFVAFWFDGWFNLKRFALGRLQFEITELGLQYKNFAPNTKVLGVHIPRSGEPLSVEACDESFQMAKRFFKNKFANGIIFTCCSWLLYPENERILSKKSNIYKFMNRFEIINFGDSETNGDLWRIFDSDEKNIKLLPRNTSLQKAYAEHLENGGKMGWGLGIIIM